jgi:ABC-type multidrug transport system permease subunit
MPTPIVTGSGASLHCWQERNNIPSGLHAKPHRRTQVFAKKCSVFELVPHDEYNSMKRKWMYIGVAAASVLLYLFDRIWRGLAFAVNDDDHHLIAKESPQLIYVVLGGAAFALLVGFFYLHIPDQKRSLQSGMKIGTILGLLVGMYQYFSLIGTLTLSSSAVVFGIVQTAAMGIICGAAISIAEKTLNAGTNPSSTLPSA